MHSPRHLPGDIVRLIALAFAALPADGFAQEPVHARELLAVSRLWRAVALPIYCSCITICTLADRRSFYWARKGLSTAKACALGWQHFATQAVVVVSGRAVEIENPMDTLATFIGVFARISRVKLHLLANPGPVFGALEAAFPAMRQIKVEANNARISPTMDAPVSSLTHIEVTACPAFSISTAPLPSLRVLVLNMTGTGVHDALTFAHQHAATLERLEVKYIHIRHCRGLLYNDFGQGVVYPHVRELTLDVLGAYDDSVLQHRISPDGNPFPSLQRLSCGAVYPFANNVLLRGAHHSLRRLIISIDASVVAWLLPEATSLRKYARLAGMEARIISRAGVHGNMDIHARVLDAAFQVHQLHWLRIRFPNLQVAEYSSKPRNKIKL